MLFRSFYSQNKQEKLQAQQTQLCFYTPPPPQSAALTEAGAADEGGGGERAGRGPVHLPGVGDEERSMLLETAGHADVVDP